MVSVKKLIEVALPPTGRARAIVMEVEHRLGFEPTDRKVEKLGYDIESRDPRTRKLRFIEVKGRMTGAETIAVTRNEILYSLNNNQRLHPHHCRIHARWRPLGVLCAPVLPVRAHTGTGLSVADVCTSVHVASARMARQRMS